MKELGLSRYFGASFLLRHHRKYAPTKSAINTNGTITAAAMTPPLTVDFFDGAAVEVALDVEEDVVEVEVEEVDWVVDVVVADVLFGLKLTAVKTI